MWQVISNEFLWPHVIAHLSWWKVKGEGRWPNLHLRMEHKPSRIIIGKHFCRPRVVWSEQQLLSLLSWSKIWQKFRTMCPFICALIWPKKSVNLPPIYGICRALRIFYLEYLRVISRGSGKVCQENQASLPVSLKVRLESNPFFRPGT